jgi:antitoxin (DNA-binding transcriptional repressor) of toxin-antitoxin stability system
MRAVTVTHFKAHCLAMLDDVARTGESVVLLRRGKPIARIVASSTAVPPSSPAKRLAGTVTIHGDLLAPVLDPDDWDANRGVLLSPRPVRGKA